MKNSREAGKRGEREAAKYLASLGFGTYGDDTRRGELVDAGLVEDSGWFGRTASGSKAVKWRLTTQGEQEART